MCAVFSGDARLSDSADGEEEPAGPSQEAPQVPLLHSIEDFLLEQSRDGTLHFALDQVIKIDGHLVRPDATQTYPQFTLIMDWLYRESCHTQIVKELPSYWYQKATEKLLSRWLIITQWLGAWGVTKH